ncbi:unnamed protein product [Ectocarpus sp. CCAP 1310/34]|nr:unnamed protein product [Ectocarpus sp. CCAP 1310/34]
MFARAMVESGGGDTACRQQRQHQRRRQQQGQQPGRPSGNARMSNPAARFSSLSSRSVLAAVAALVVAMLAGEVGAADAGIPSDYRVVHTHVVMRHGERTRLRKDTETEFGDSDGVVLTNVGEEQCYDLGKQLRERYLPASNSAEYTTTIEGLTLWYDADRVQIESSGYDRTLESAAAMALGLYPMGQNDTDVEQNSLLWMEQIVVPIHSSKPQNDPYITAYDKCPVYNANWIQSYEKDEFQELQRVASEEQEDGSDGFITQVYNIFDEFRGANDNPDCWDEVIALKLDQLELHAPYNLWDCARTLLAAGKDQTVNFINAATIPTDFSEQYPDIIDGWLYLGWLVDEVEDMKYEQDVVGRYAAGLYLTEMNLRMSQVIEHVRSGYMSNVGRFPGMHITSGHYGTLKGIAGALDIDAIDGIPEYASHFAFELLYNGSANHRAGEEDFAIRIMYQDGSSTSDLNFAVMGQVYDGSGSISDFDEELSTLRDYDTGIMGWTQWDYLMDYQNAGKPVVYESVEEWCLDCLATAPDTCIAQELELMTQQWEEASVQAEQATADYKEADDGIGGKYCVHVALLSIFGVVLGIGIGICIKPCLDRHNKMLNQKSQASTISGDRGLEAWSSAANSNNGSFRLGAKHTSTRQVGGNRMMAVPSAPDDDMDSSGRMDGGANGAYTNGNGSGQYDIEEDSTPGIPEFAPTSALGEPVPFPHKRQASGMVSGVDSSMMSGIDADDVDDDDVAGGGTSRQGKAGSSDVTATTTKIDTVEEEPATGETQPEGTAPIV